MGWLSPTAGAALLMVLAALYGANAPLLKSVEDLAPHGLTSTELVSLRFLTAAAPLLVAVVPHLGQLRRALAAGTELGLYLWAAYTLQMLGLEKVPATTATVLFALCGLMVQCLELTFDRKPLSPGTVLSSLGAVLGLGLFVTAPPPVGQEHGRLWTAIDHLRRYLEGVFAPPPAPHETLLQGVPGEALVLCGTFLFAVHVWRSAALIPQAHGDVEEEPDEGEFGYGLALGAVQLVVCAVLGVALSLLDSNSASAVQAQLAVIRNLDADLWLRIFASGVLCTGMPQTLELFALKVTPPAQAALIYCTIPVWGTALSVALLRDPLAPQAVLGGLLIVLCSIPRGEAEDHPGAAAQDGAVCRAALEVQDQPGAAAQHGAICDAALDIQVDCWSYPESARRAARARALQRTLQALPVPLSEARSHLA